MVVGPQRLHRNRFTEDKLVRKTGKELELIQKLKLICKRYK
jgi:hypothetical protein